MSTGRTFILATSRADAIAWCRKNGVKPYATNTIILTNAHACRGHEFREDDTAYNLGWSTELADEWQVVAAAWRDANPLEDPWDSDDWEVWS